MSALFEKRLIYVTGKGGVGKTTVAASLGLAAAQAGKRTIVCEVAEQDRLHRAFARQGVGESEVQLDTNLWAVTIDPQAALEEWLGKQLGGGPVFRTLARSSAFQYFVAAGPGLKELITIAKVWETGQVERWSKGGRNYDLVIVDAPASGHGLAMLMTPSTYGDIARVGPIRRQSGKIRALLTDAEQTSYVAVALPEEMPVTETLELQDKLVEAVGLGLDHVVVNGLLPDRFTNADAKALTAAAGSNGNDPVLRAALEEHERARGQRSQLRRIKRGAEASVLTLPFLYEPDLGLDSYRELATELAKQLP